jgi:two-component system response regulator PilR (NtrC family)
MKGARVLVVDDEASLVEFLELLLRGEGYEVATADSVSRALEVLERKNVDLILCDLHMPKASGLDLLRELRAQPTPAPAVIVMTAYTSTESAVEAMKLGAYDYVSKPFDVEELKLLVQRALEKTSLAAENRWLRGELEQRWSHGNIIGRSRAMVQIFEMIERIARTNSTVLIEGESGTGKELIARAIHIASPRQNGRFLSINCGAMPENLLESELFGHERGAFTGAVKEKRGLFQEADGGSLFLDEIGEMTTTMQVKLLRALQSRTVRKVGGSREESVDVRILAATNRDLAELVRTGRFREDLFYRINVIPVRLPPLRRRREDIPLPVDHFLAAKSRDMGITPKRISVEAMRMLEAYAWPGNVRELENLIERVLALCGGDTILAEDLPAAVRTPGATAAIGYDLPDEGLDLEAWLDDRRRELMAQALERTGGNQTKAAELLAMTFRSFRYYAKKLGLTGDDEEP